MSEKFVCPICSTQDITPNGRASIPIGKGRVHIDCLRKQAAKKTMVYLIDEIIREHIETIEPGDVVKVFEIIFAKTYTGKIIWTAGEIQKELLVNIADGSLITPPNPTCEKAFAVIDRNNKYTAAINAVSEIYFFLYFSNSPE